MLQAQGLKRQAGCGATMTTPACQAYFGQDRLSRPTYHIVGVATSTPEQVSCAMRRASCRDLLLLQRLVEGLQAGEDVRGAR